MHRIGTCRVVQKPQRARSGWHAARTILYRFFVDSICVGRLVSFLVPVGDGYHNSNNYPQETVATIRIMFRWYIVCGATGQPSPLILLGTFTCTFCSLCGSTIRTCLQSYFKTGCTEFGGGIRGERSQTATARHTRTRASSAPKRLAHWS
jgi:hypothetical protein